MSDLTNMKSVMHNLIIYNETEGLDLTTSLITLKVILKI